MTVKDFNDTVPNVLGHSKKMVGRRKMIGYDMATMIDYPGYKK